MRISLIGAVLLLVVASPTIAAPLPPTIDAAGGAVDSFLQQNGCDAQAAIQAMGSIDDLQGQADRFAASGQAMPMDVAALRASILSLKFSLADGAKLKECLGVAQQEYLSIVTYYDGPGEGGIRDRAKIGIDDVREIRARQ